MSVEAEMSVLGGMMLDVKCAQVACDALYADMFSHDTTRTIFEKALDMYWEGKVIDGVSLSHELPEHKDTIFKLANYVPSLSNYREYVKIVQDDYQLSVITKTCMSIGANPGSLPDAIEKVRSLAETQAEMLKLRGNEDIQSFAEAVNDFRKWITDHTKKESIFTGYDQLDKAMGGILRSSVCALAARPGWGKTDFAVNLSLRMAKRGAKVLYLTMEMPTLQLMQRVASNMLKIDGTRIRDKTLSDDEIKSVDTILSICEHNGQFGFVQETQITVQRVRHFVDLWKPDVVIIDHLGLMKRPKMENKNQALGEVSNAIKRLALEKKIAIIELVQMNRQIETRAGANPTLSDLRESGDIEQDCDYVIFVKPEEDMKGKNLVGNDSVNSLLIVAKNRHGATGIFDMKWQPQYHRYTEVEGRF
ncbi:MAG: replicative DNA helicase [Lachnospiraceae bacterium]|jgi:replicative DNA helicase